MQTLILYLLHVCIRMCRCSNPSGPSPFPGVPRVWPADPCRQAVRATHQHLRPPLQVRRYLIIYSLFNESLYNLLSLII